MVGIGLVLVAFCVIYYTHLLIKWRYPKINGVRVQLPPGSMGLPVIGETIQLLIPSYNSIDIHPFVRKRIQRHGPIFRTNLVGRPIIVSADPEVNKYIFSQEGNLVEMWYLDSFAKLFAFEGESKVTAIGRVHKYLRGITLNHFGGESLREKMLPQIEVAMIFNFTAKVAFGYDVETSKGEKIENLPNFIKSLMSFPLNIPGTTFHKCMKDKEKMANMVRHIMKERFNSPDKRPGDFLDQAINDMASEKFLTEDFIAELAFGILFAAFESVSNNTNTSYQAENEAVLKKRENPDSLLTWEEYRTMSFTSSVVNETLRLMNIPPGLLRKALKDIHVKGYTIPAGWTIMLVTPIVHLNPETYKDPLKFNPWRWKDLDQATLSKSFMPFGGGTRQCAGAEFSKVYMATFLHVLVTKYRWTKVKGGRITRSPILLFPDGVHIKVSSKLGLVAVTLVVIYFSHLIMKWKNPKIDGVLPPGSMGWPLIGETLQFIAPGRSLDLHPFVKKRMQKYGPIFKTSLVGRPIIVSTDNETNKYILQNEGTLVELWYLDSFAKVFSLEGETRLNAIGRVHRYIRSITLNHFGVESLKESLLPKIEDMIHTNLSKWATQGPVDIKHMVFNFVANKIGGYDAENSKEKLSDNCINILNSFISFPLNIPGTSFHRCMQWIPSPNSCSGSYLPTFESMSTILTVTFKFLSENTRVVEELAAEHDAIVRKRENPNSRLTWEEYKSMTFTQMVVNEALRISNNLPGLFRKALKDFQVKGYTVPAGWTILLVTPAAQLNPETFKDPITFNPWRWKDLDQVTISKNFMPFGGGNRQCAGAEYSKLVLSTFLHVYPRSREETFLALLSFHLVMASILNLQPKIDGVFLPCLLEVHVHDLRTYPLCYASWVSCETSFGSNLTRDRIALKIQKLVDGGHF
uniref:Cytochrome P450 n=1 Tax=Salix viminalis TaxID=40686 RepID=A0A6N2L4R0_SALVM